MDAPPTSMAPPAASTAAAGASAEEMAAKAVHKRYEGLVMVRTKAVKGKGAWYWAHLEPLLVHSSDTGLPKAVKLRCSLCDAQFSASNPSRTASEHLKRGTCPNFTSLPRPISSVSSISPTSPPPPPPPQQHPPPPHPPPEQQQQHNRRKRSSSGSGGSGGSSYHQASPLAMVDPSRFCAEMAYSQAAMAATASGGAGGGSSALSQHQHQHHQQPPHLVLSGGKEDLGALAMLEDSVRKLRSPKTSPGPALSKAQVDSALYFLADWLYECCGSVSFSSLEHPKFRAFLNQVGFPAVSPRDFVGSRLDARYEEARAESEAKIRDAMFFQIASDGWRPKASSAPFGEENSMNLVSLTVNLPNGTSVFRRAAFTSQPVVPSEYAEEVLWETITYTCGASVQQCVGIVADKYKTKALRKLENEHRWMVNLLCQFQGLTSLIKDFGKELPLFGKVGDNCLKLAGFLNENSQLRSGFHKHQLREYGHAGLLRMPLHEPGVRNFGASSVMVEDVLNSVRALQLAVLDEPFKVAAMEDPVAREVSDMIQDLGFWNEAEAVHALVKMVREIAQKIETERPLVGQCLPLWNELRTRVKEWCSKFQIPERPVEKVIEKRFKKNYHPAWAAAFILDPLHLIRDTSGKYLPPFKCLTAEQEKDVDRLITRLVSREEAHIALMELMKWRTDGLDPVYAQAVQMKERDQVTGKMKLSNPQSSRLVWETYLTEFKSLPKVAVRLIFLHATSCGFKCHPSFLRWVSSAKGRSRMGTERAQKMVFIAAHSKLEKRDFSIGDDKDSELFGSAIEALGQDIVGLERPP